MQSTPQSLRDLCIHVIAHNLALYEFHGAPDHLQNKIFEFVAPGSFLTAELVNKFEKIQVVPGCVGATPGGIQALRNHATSLVELKLENVSNVNGLGGLLKHLVNVTSIDLSGLSLGRKEICHLSGLQSLKILNLSSTPIDTAGLEAVVKITSLTDLDLSCCRALKSLDPVWKQATQLEVLKLREIFPPYACASKTIQLLPKLRVLDMSSRSGGYLCMLFFPNKIRRVLTITSNLLVWGRLCLQPHRTSESASNQRSYQYPQLMEFILENFPNLKALDISYASGLDMESVEQFTNLQNLEYLDVSHVSDLFATSREHLLQYLPNLKVLLDNHATYGRGGGESVETPVKIKPKIFTDFDDAEPWIKREFLEDKGTTLLILNEFLSQTRTPHKATHMRTRRRRNRTTVKRSSYRRTRFHQSAPDTANNRETRPNRKPRPDHESESDESDFDPETNTYKVNSTIFTTNVSGRGRGSYGRGTFRRNWGDRGAAAVGGAFSVEQHGMGLFDDDPLGIFGDGGDGGDGVGDGEARVYPHFGCTPAELDEYLEVFTKFFRHYAYLKIASSLSPLSSSVVIPSSEVHTTPSFPLDEDVNPIKLVKKAAKAVQRFHKILKQYNIPSKGKTADLIGRLLGLLMEVIRRYSMQCSIVTITLSTFLRLLPYSSNQNLLKNKVGLLTDLLRAHVPHPSLQKRVLRALTIAIPTRFAVKGLPKPLVQDLAQQLIKTGTENKSLMEPCGKLLFTMSMLHLLKQRGLATSVSNMEFINHIKRKVRKMMKNQKRRYYTNKRRYWKIKKQHDQENKLRKLANAAKQRAKEGKPTGQVGMAAGVGLVPVMRPFGRGSPTTTTTNRRGGGTARSRGRGGKTPSRTAKR